MKVLAVIAYTALILWGLCKLTRVRQQPEDWLNFPEADSYIEHLNSLRMQLHNIEELLTDLQLHEAGKSEAPITLAWSSFSGERHEAVIYINASPEVNTKLTELAQSERKRLRLSLQSELQNTPVRHNANGYANDANNQREGSE